LSDGDLLAVETDPGVARRRQCAFDRSAHAEPDRSRLRLERGVSRADEDERSSDQRRRADARVRRPQGRRGGAECSQEREVSPDHP
jgi:hypothetical protein